MYCQNDVPLDRSPTLPLWGRQKTPGLGNSSRTSDALQRVVSAILGLAVASSRDDGPPPICSSEPSEELRLIRLVLRGFLLSIRLGNRTLNVYFTVLLGFPPLSHALLFSSAELGEIIH